MKIMRNSRHEEALVASAKRRDRTLRTFSFVRNIVHKDIIARLLDKAEISFHK